MKSIALEKTIAAGLLVSVAFTALAHGAVEAWSIAFFELITLLLLFLWAIKSFIERRGELKVPATALPLAAFLLLGLIQSVAVTDADGQTRSLSLNVEATRGAVRTLFFLLAAHVVAANFFETRERLRKLSVFLTIFGFALAVFGLLQYFTWNGCLYWLRPAQVTTAGVVGPFVNHNHFAGYLELIVPLPIALVLTGALKRNRVLYGFAAVVTAVALAASLSRGGIVSLAGGLLFVVAASFKDARRRRRTAASPNGGRDVDEREFSADFKEPSVINYAAAFLVVGAIAAGTLWIGSGPLIDRLTKNEVLSQDAKAESFENSRGWIWKNSIAMFRANPVTGVGIGAYETAYPQYSSENKGLSQAIDRAHNDYLQMLDDGGLIGALIALWFAWTVLTLVKRSLRAGPPFESAMAIGCGAAIFSLMIHSVFDFNLQIPSTALLFLVLTAATTNLAEQSLEH